MKITKNNPVREFNVGSKQEIRIRDCGRIYLEPNEMITFSGPADSEYDVTRKEWGYYATPSINKRLLNFGFKTALVRNSERHIFVMLVKEDKMQLFMDYLSRENSELLSWLDADSAFINS